MTSKLPYPPPPEFGWYADDETAADQLLPEQQRDEYSSAHSEHSEHNEHNNPVDHEQLAAEQTAYEEAALAAFEQFGGVTQLADQDEPHLFFDDSRDPITGEPLEFIAQSDAHGGDEWDGTVLSHTFMQANPTVTYVLTNAVTNQRIVIDMGVLIGRKPSHDIPHGAKAVRLIDPTRTVSRNHAALSLDPDGTLWIEDYHSLNGTSIIVDDTETLVTQGERVQVPVPARIRIGDQLLTLSAAESEA